MSAPEPIVKTLHLSHGTLEVSDLKKARRFYEEFLGLECVRHVKPAMLVRKGDLAIVCMEVGEKIKGKLSLMNHWGLDVASRDEVDAAHERAAALKDEYEIRSMTKPGDQHGAYSFYMEDRDGNWWEIQHAPQNDGDLVFGRGDQFPM